MALAMEVLEIPAEHVACLRGAIKGELAADCDELPTFDPGPADFGKLPLIEMHRAALDQLGWGDDVSPRQIEADPDYLTAMLTSAMDTASSRAAEAVGEYQGDKPPDIAVAKRAAADILWLVDAWEGLATEAVAA